MRKIPKLRIGIGVLLLGLVNITAVARADTATINTKAGTQTKSVELTQLNQKIQQLQNAIAQNQQQRTQVSDHLHNNATLLTKLQQHLLLLNTQLHQQQTALAQLQQNQQVQRQQLAMQYGGLAEQMRAAYLLTQEKHDSLFTDADIDTDDANTDQLLVYVDSLDKTRLNSIDQLTQTLGQLKSKQSQVFNQKVVLQSTLIKQQKTQQQLAVAQQSQQQVLKQLNNQLQNNGTQLNELIANKKALEQLIQRLANEQQRKQKLQHVSTSLPLPTGIPLVQLQGKLPWPAAGTIGNHFGMPIAQSEMKSSGVLITTPSGQTVHAVYQGRVVFADELRGLGLLLIIEHADGYMTLYGHNQTLNKRVGDLVRPGETVATVGSDGLYFEIRHEGHPLDPEVWLAKTK